MGSPGRTAEYDRHRGELLRDAERVIRLRYRDPDLSVGDVAAEVGVSARQLQRTFQSVGESFRGFLLRHRMERARELLSRVHAPLPTRVVAHRVGYRGPSGLRQAFGRYYGVPPSAVQRPPPEYLGSEVAPDEAGDGRESALLWTKPRKGGTEANPG